MSKSGNKAKVETLKAWFSQVKIVRKKPKEEKTEYKVNIKGFTK